MICVKWLRGAEEAWPPRVREGSRSLSGQPSPNQGTHTSGVPHILLDTWIGGLLRLRPGVIQRPCMALTGPRGWETLLPPPASPPAARLRHVPAA